MKELAFQLRNKVNIFHFLLNDLVMLSEEQFNLLLSFFQLRLSYNNESNKSLFWFTVYFFLFLNNFVLWMCKFK
jgi:hypothetical protein